MGRVYNFSAGPAVLPEEVLREAAEEMLDYNGSGMSVLVMSHRSKPFQEIIDAAECTKLTELSEDRLGTAIKIAKSWKNFDEDTKKTIQRTVQLLFQMARRNLRQR